MGFWRLFAAAGDSLLDPSIVFSFDATGYLRHSVGFDAADLDVDLSGRVIAVTGANSGIGYATTAALAARGARVLMFCRNAERAATAAESIRGDCARADLHVVPLDLSDPSSVQSVQQRLPSGPIDVLVHNAGILPRQHIVTPWELELTLATNLVGPLALTAQLLPQLRQGSRARIIWVSSGGMYSQALQVEALNASDQGFDGVAAYARTKRAMVVLSEQLAQHLAPSHIAVHAMHPGWAETPGVKSSIPGFWRVTRRILRSPEQGADTVVWLAACDKAQQQSGLFWFDRKPRSLYLVPGKKEKLAERELLWRQVHIWAKLEPTAFSG
jgi:dehydrogenase/reductase SDR family member 12